MKTSSTYIPLSILFYMKQIILYNYISVNKHYLHYLWVKICNIGMYFFIWNELGPFWSVRYTTLTFVVENEERLDTLLLWLRTGSHTGVATNVKRSNSGWKEKWLFIMNWTIETITLSGWTTEVSLSFKIIFNFLLQVHPVKSHPQLYYGTNWNTKQY